MSHARTVLVSLFLGLSAFAQEPKPVLIEPGSKLVRVKELPAHSATYVLYRGTGPDRIAMQEIRRELATVERDGEKLLGLSWHTRAMGREVVDELLLDPRTLAPRARVIPLPTGGVATLAVDGAHVTGELAGPDGQVTEEVDVTFTAALHDASLPLLASLPLKAGATFRLATLPQDLGETPAEPNWLEVTVDERAPCALPDGFELDAWPLELTSKTGGPRTKLWLADEEPFVLKKEISLPGFGEIVWELKLDD